MHVCVLVCVGVCVCVCVYVHRLVPIGAVLGLPAADSKSLAPYHTWRQLPQPAQAAPAAAAAQLESLQLTALGWGATTTGSSLPLQLQSGRVSPVAMDKCQRLFDPFGSKITPRMVCVAGTRLCVHTHTHAQVRIHTRTHTQTQAHTQTHVP